ncbi:hypothetical protein PQR34_06885 [Paraburkholderia sediminicola]
MMVTSAFGIIAAISRAMVGVDSRSSSPHITWVAIDQLVECLRRGFRADERFCDWNRNVLRFFAADQGFLPPPHEFGSIGLTEMGESIHRGAQRQRQETIGVMFREAHGDLAAHGKADDMCAFLAEKVEDTRQIMDEIQTIQITIIIIALAVAARIPGSGMEMFAERGEKS